MKAEKYGAKILKVMEEHEKLEKTERHSGEENFEKSERRGEKRSREGKLHPEVNRNNSQKRIKSKNHVTSTKVKNGESHQTKGSMTRKNLVLVESSSEGDFC